MHTDLMSARMFRVLSYPTRVVHWTLFDERSFRSSRFIAGHSLDIPPDCTEADRRGLDARLAREMVYQSLASVRVEYCLHWCR